MRFNKVTWASMFEKTLGWQGQKQEAWSTDDFNNPSPRWCLNQKGGCSKKWLNSKCISKVEPAGFVDRVHVREEAEV